MWASARISVMGGEQAANVLLTVKQEGLHREGKPLLSPEEQEEFRRPIIETYEREGSPLYSTAHIWDDGLIEPLETRKLLARGISMSLNAPLSPPEEGSKYGVFRM